MEYKTYANAGRSTNILTNVISTKNRVKPANIRGINFANLYLENAEPI
jgi:hypothetical protein